MAKRDSVRLAVLRVLHGDHCHDSMRVVVGGTPVMFDHGRAPAPADVAMGTA